MSRSRPNHINHGRKGAKYYGSETLAAASLATCGDVAFYTLFERYDNCHAHLWTSGNRSTLWNRGPDGLISNATVVVTDNQTKQSHTAMTNAQGAFSFPQLAVGSYTVSFSAPGFKTFNATDVRIDVGKEYVLTPTLEVGAIEEKVNVFASRALKVPPRTPPTAIQR